MAKLASFSRPRPVMYQLRYHPLSPVLQVIMFWIVDSILMHKRKSDAKVTEVQYHRQRSCSPRYGKLGSESDSCLSCSEGEAETIIFQETSLSGPQDRVAPHR